MTTIDAPTWPTVRQAMAVNLPEIDSEGVRVARFEIERQDISNMLTALKYGRGADPGTYTRLTVDGRLWMTDTTAERRDHDTALYEIFTRRAERVVINGLGLGMIVGAALTMPWVKHIDVVERDDRVARLIGQHYERSGRVNVHVADAYEQARAWPKGTRWDVGWSDIWPDLTTDNLPLMAVLNRAYGRRCDWHRCWGVELLRRHARHDRRLGW